MKIIRNSMVEKDMYRIKIETIGKCKKKCNELTTPMVQYAYATWQVKTCSIECLEILIRIMIIPSSMAIPRCTSSGCFEWTSAHDNLIMLSLFSSSESPLLASATSFSHPWPTIHKHSSVFNSSKQKPNQIGLAEQRGTQISVSFFLQGSSFLGKQTENEHWGFVVCTYVDDVAVAPGDRISAAEKVSDGVKKFVKHLFHFVVADDEMIESQFSGGILLGLDLVFIGLWGYFQVFFI